jgi:hypothetical protein
LCWCVYVNMSTVSYVFEIYSSTPGKDLPFYYVFFWWSKIIVFNIVWCIFFYNIFWGYVLAQIYLVLMSVYWMHPFIITDSFLFIILLHVSCVCCSTSTPAIFQFVFIYLLLCSLSLYHFIPSEVVSNISVIWLLF